MSEAPRILCILPAYNEEGKIGRVVQKIHATGLVDEIVVTDDSSTDGTGREAGAAGATVIRHNVNMGVGAGIRSGIGYGRQHGFDIAVIMSGDDQHDPKELPAVLRPLIERKADFVQGSRRLVGGKTVDGPLFREVMTRLYSLIFTILTLRRITDGTNGFRGFWLSIFDDSAFNLEQEWLNTYELEPYLLWRAVTSRRWRVIEVPITIYYRRKTGDFSKMKPFRDWWRLLRPLFFLRLGIRR